MNGNASGNKRPPTDGPSHPIRRRTNVNKACDNCRHRRVKCDGVQPSCGTCGVYKDECQWDTREDYRKPLPRRQVQALVMRVQDLERLLEEHGIEAGSGLSGSTRDGRDGQREVSQLKVDEGSVDREVEVQEEKQSEVPDDPRDLSLNHLVEREDGDLHLHGPTSAFRHLGKYPHVPSSGLNIYPVPLSHHALLSGGYSRYLPQGIQLLETEHDICIDRFFGYYACWGMRSNSRLFKQDMAIALSPPYPRTPHYSPLLHNAILAIGLGFSDDPYLRHPATRKIFCNHAKSFIDEEGMTPTVATVQALAHLASYHSLCAEHNLGWLYIGMALRCAVALGLNTDVTHLLERGHITVEQGKERNTTFWTIFIQEGVWAPYIGRSMSTPAYTTHLPQIDHDLDRSEWIPIAHGSDSLRSQPSLLSTTFVHTVKLMMIGERIMNTLYGIKVDLPNIQRTAAISDISLALSNWLEELPQSLGLNIHSPHNALPHILMMHLSHAWLVILLHRPFYRPLAGLGNVTKEAPCAQSSRAAWAVKQCDKAAVHVIHLLWIWHKYHDLRYCPPTALQVCFVAGTTHLLSLASARSNSKRQAESVARVDECLKLLGHMAQSWLAAEQARALLEGLREEYGFSSHGSGKSVQKPIPTGPAVVVPATTGRSRAATVTGVPWTMPQSSISDNLAGASNSWSNIRSSSISNEELLHTSPLLQTKYDPTLSTGLDLSSTPNQSWSYPEPYQDIGTSGQMSTGNGNGNGTGNDSSIAWHEFDFGFSNDDPEGGVGTGQVDPEIEALLNTILQPHLYVGNSGFDPGPPYM